HHETYIQCSRSVIAQRLPVAAAGKDLAPQFLALEAAARDFADAPVVARRCTDHAGRLDLDLKYEQRLITQRVHAGREYCRQRLYLHRYLQTNAPLRPQSVEPVAPPSLLPEWNTRLRRGGRLESEQPRTSTVAGGPNRRPITPGQCFVLG